MHKENRALWPMEHKGIIGRESGDKKGYIIESRLTTWIIFTKRNLVISLSKNVAITISSSYEHTDSKGLDGSRPTLSLISKIWVYTKFKMERLLGWFSASF